MKHFARVLINVDMTQKPRDCIMVEREGYAFLFTFCMKNLSLFCESCKIVGYSLDNYWKYSIDHGITQYVEDVTFVRKLVKKI